MTAEIDYTTFEASIQSAIEDDDVLALNLLLQTHPTYEEFDQYSRPKTALNKLDIVKALLKHGVPPNALTINGRPAIEVAACYGYLKSVKLLIKAGADVNAANADGVTALHSSSRHGHFPTTELLLEHGASVDAVTHLGNTVLHFDTLSYSCNKFDRRKMAKLLLKHGADPTKPNKNGVMPTETAKKANRPYLAELLEDHQLRLVIKRYGAHLLRAAITTGNLSDVPLLISLGAEPNEYSDEDSDSDNDL